MGLWKSLYRLVRNFLIFFFLIALLPGLPPKTHFDFQSFSVPKPLDFTGPLELNNLLENVERLYEGQVHGPEALLKRGDEIYASIIGGEVIKIVGDHITHVAKFGKPCEVVEEEAICGRPLGMAFDTLGDNLIVADAYYGIWLVDLKTGKKTNLISPNIELDGKVKRKPKIFNSVTVSKSGDIYWTESSSDFYLQDGVYTLFANPCGRLFQYNRTTKENRVLIDELYFANGVALSPNEDFVIVSETVGSRLMRYYLKGEKTGQSEIFIDRLPGLPDNLTPDEDGVWVPLCSGIDQENPAVYQTATNVPLIRKFIVRFMYLIELPFKTIENIYPNPYTQKIVYNLGNFKSFNVIRANRNTILRIDWNGKIIGSLHGFDHSVAHISHVMEDGDYLYLGSYVNSYIGRVKLPRIYKDTKTPSNQKPQFETTTTTTTTSKPSSTTPNTPTKTATQKPKTTPPNKVETPKLTESPQNVETPKKVETSKQTGSAKPVGVPKVKDVPKTTKQQPKTDQKKPIEPAPIHENIPSDTKRHEQENIKIIKRGGEHGEL